MGASDEYRAAVLHYLTTRLGKQPLLSELVNQPETWSVGLAKFMHSPIVGCATHATVGLGELSLSRKNGRRFPGATELLALTLPTVRHFENALAALCFNCLKFGHVCAPGDVFKGVLDQAIPGLTVPHLFATDPYVWQSGEHTLEPVLCGERTVYWVMLVPISDGELAFCRDRGERALCQRLEERDAQVTDLWRGSTA